ncbi:MAG: hypothetical protein ACYDEP_03190 [Acidimicrobiales bacterium]
MGAQRGQELRGGRNGGGIQIGGIEETGEPSPLSRRKIRLREGQANMDPAAGDHGLEGTQLPVAVAHRPGFEVVPEFEHAVEVGKHASLLHAEQRAEPRVVGVRRELALDAGREDEDGEVGNVRGVRALPGSPAVAGLQCLLADARPRYPGRTAEGGFDEVAELPAKGTSDLPDQVLVDLQVDSLSGVLSVEEMGREGVVPSQVVPTGLQVLPWRCHGAPPAGTASLATRQDITGRD